MDSQPLVSVCIQTYQHAPFIRQCLSSVVAQETTFPFEIIIGEDDSTDGTREICIEFAERYPHLIRLFLRSEKDKVYINGKKTGRLNFIRNLEAARGTYIALLDGDDYWCAPDKLARQAAFLEAHPRYGICFHSIYTLERDQRVLHAEKEEDFTLEDLAHRMFIHTSSLFFRRPQPFVIPGYFWKTPFLDYPVTLFAGRSGPAHRLPEAMSVYRIHEKGFWSGESSVQNARALHKVLSILIPEHAPHVQPILQRHRMRNIKTIIRHYLVHRNNGELDLFLQSIQPDLNPEEAAGVRSYRALCNIPLSIKGSLLRLIRSFPHQKPQLTQR